MFPRKPQAAFLVGLFLTGEWVIGLRNRPLMTIDRKIRNSVVMLNFGSGCVQTEWKIEKKKKRNQFVFESVLDVVSKQNPNVKREMQPKNMGELQPTGRSKLCTHADNLALGNTDPPEQQAYTTTFRPREVVGPPMEVVARPTLTPRDQTSNYTENELQASFSRASC